MAKNIKRVLVALLAVLMLIPAYGVGTSAASTTLATYNTASGTPHVATEIDEFTEVATHFNATGSFSAVSLCIPSYSDNKGSIKAALYKWDMNYIKTIAADPVASAVWVDTKDNATQTLSFESQEAGEYLFLISDGSGGIGVWVRNEAAEEFEFYRDQMKSAATLEAEVRFDDAATAGFMDPTVERWELYWQDGQPSLTEDCNIVNIDEYTLVDGLGRSFDEENAVPEEEKTVGVFFWAWHHKFTSLYPYNLNNLILQNPDAKNDYDHPIWNSYGAHTMAFWNEPIYGFYSSCDKWVMRKQAELLADAGVDVIILDCTNGRYTWSKSYRLLAETFLEAMEDGIDVPKIAFMCNFVSEGDIQAEVRSLYTDFYSSDKYSDLWFWWKGKPLMLADKDAFNVLNPIDAGILEFFNFREPDPFYFTPNTSNSRWGWLSTNPQTLYRNEDGSVEQVTVGVAQNAYENELVAMNDPRGAYGRSHTNDPDYSYTYENAGEEITVDSDIENSTYYGLNFQEQWDYAIEHDPEFVFVTGWNEWVANRYDVWQGTENGFPDTFNDEYSRDCEPTKGELKDYYYTQLAINIRRYKGAEKSEPEHEFVTVRPEEGLSQWDTVKSYYDYTDDYADRSQSGYQGRTYANDAPRNDIVEAKVAMDESNFFFYVETRETLTDPEGADWMVLYLDTADSADNYLGYEYRVKSNRRLSVLQKMVGGEWTQVAELERTINDNVLIFPISRADLELDGEGGAALSFKWTDDVSLEDIMEVYTVGDAAPGSRFAYYYENDGAEGNPTYNPFVDVKYGKWYTDGVIYCYRNGYMAGVSENTFAYKTTVDRQMFATILAKIDGADLSSYTGTSFTDVKPGQWYSAAIEWAYQNGYASGLGDGIFGRKDPVTREQIALFLYTYSEKKGIADVSEKADLSVFSDADRVHSWAKTGLEWAVSVGLISGTSEITLSPRDSATRAEVSLIVMNYVEMAVSIDSIDSIE